MIALLEARRAGLYARQHRLPNIVAGVVFGVAALPLAMAVRHRVWRTARTRAIHGDHRRRVGRDLCADGAMGSDLASCHLP